MDKYEGRRITINYLAVAELCRAEGIPDDAPNAAIAAAVEKMIFKGVVAASTSASAPQPVQTKTEAPANKAGLAAMINQVKKSA